MKRPLGAQISHMLRDRGVDVIFGIPGVHNQEMYRGIEEAGITHILARHEQGAGFMADGYARATGKPGVAYVITGPGLCNIMTPMGQGYSDSVPMLVLSSCLDETEASKGQLHQMKDQRGAAETVADWSVQANSAQAAYGLVERAFEEFELSRPRPKHIQVPIKQLEAEADPAPFPNQPGLRTKAAPPDVASVMSMLNIARRPLFILGGGTRSNLWRQILTQLGAACFTTYAGRGMAGLNYALDFGAYLPRPSSAEVIASADLVVVVGAELGEVDLWRDDLGHSGNLIRVDLDPAVLSDRHRAAVKLQVDGESFAHALWAAIDHVKPATGWTEDEVAQARAKWRIEVDAERPGIVPVLDALREAMPAETMVYSDMTQLAYVGKEVWDMTFPYHWHHPTGFGTLGYALPAGIGGAVARRGKPTAVFAGDYGFHYTMMELGVAVELGLSLPIILWDNGKLREIEDSMVRSQIAPNAVVARNPDFCKLAEAFGARSAEPVSLEDMQVAVRAAFDAQGPTLIRITPDIL
ncbi:MULTISPECIES: thiamine pyrophosphate-binding protein [unclassified Ruegeria]|uniref:thiamine pyrophosphate-binding protein n=1 Tax=unclassified Ruegeria TaxID=2625375 RepID=UPI001ADBF1BB|nr:MULTISPECIES: thiamine pyrophosphate-binding protein [unclassified Ruegeria]MBO9412873.1 acetolactate synthase isozyme1 large subunit [Ruegeria sp. R8_1]MBO9416580.1 acetolactate synthase isozyme1 large subunit [Ruegeria sp. R8_2]